MDKQYSVAIIGGGLAGLYAGYQLSQQGISDYVILEANDTFGGRIKPFETEGFDLGATWFWSEYQPELSSLIEQLQLERFNQYEQGNMLIERTSSEPPKAVRGYFSSPTSHRLQGGISRLVHSLVSLQKSTALYTAHQVKKLTQQAEHIEIETVYQNETKRFYAQKVLLALPPRLAAQLEFVPSLPKSLVQAWQNTPTWMAPHAKYIAVYETPFWREQGLSGYAHSQHGPMSEIHDISMPTGRGALFGFLGIPAPFRAKVGEEQLKAHCRHQLVRLYGEQAAHPVAEIIKDWAQDPFTATVLDQNANAAHHIAPPNQANEGKWQHILFGIASEWSPNFSGYLAGAIESVDFVLREL